LSFLLVSYFLLFTGPIYASEPPSPPTYGVRMEQAWIPMKDGVRLAATLYMPDGAKAGEKFPALLEYLAVSQRRWHRRGRLSQACLFRAPRVRGRARRHSRVRRERGRAAGTRVFRAGASRRRAGHRVAGASTLVNGNVGMFGISWGGFTAMQMAMRHAPALKAIVALHATAELFHDDVHYVDGMAHIDEFELNMDMAEGWVGAPDYSLDEKVLGPRFDSPPWSLLY
jgi:predicted acyl esterase